MLFSSMIFLWCFLPAVIVIYYLAGPRLRNTFLFLASLLFYAWGEPVYIWLMLFSILINYAGGLLVDLDSKRRKVFLFLNIVLNQQ